MPANHSLPRKSPSAAGADAQGILDFVDAIEREKMEYHALMVVRGGAVVAEGAWKPYDLALPHMQHSATKSWAGAAVGLAFDDGLLNLDDRVVQFFPEHLPPTVSENLRAMTVRDLLTMRTGHRQGISGGEWRGLRSSWVAAFLAEPVDDVPGDGFMYGSGASYMLSAIVTKVTGRLVHDLMQERLFEPMGIGPVTWDVSPEGYNSGGNGLTCSAEDSAKFGLLHLRGGLWNGRRLLSERWVREATRNQVREAWIAQKMDGGRRMQRASDPSMNTRVEGYGYQWWIAPDSAFRASGLFGQQIIVLPEQDSVVVYNAGLRWPEPRSLKLVWKHLLPALGGTAGSAAADAALQERLAGVALADAPAGEPDSGIAAAVSGTRWTMEANEDRVEWVQLDFTDGACTFTLKDHRGVHAIRAGIGAALASETTMTGNMLHHQYQPDAMRVVAQGVWQGRDRFVMSWRFTGTAFRDMVECAFANGVIRIDRSVNTNSSDLRRPTLVGRQ